MEHLCRTVYQHWFYAGQILIDLLSKGQTLNYLLKAKTRSIFWKQTKYHESSIHETLYWLYFHKKNYIFPNFKSKDQIMSDHYNMSYISKQTKCVHIVIIIVIGWMHVYDFNSTFIYEENYLSYKNPSLNIYFLKIKLKYSQTPVVVPRKIQKFMIQNDEIPFHQNFTLNH